MKQNCPMITQNLNVKCQNYISKLKTKKVLKILVMVLSFAFCVLSLKQAQAQTNSTAYTISPPIQELEADPSETVTYTIKAISNQDTPLALQLKIFDFIVQDDKGTPILIADELKDLTPNNLRRFSLVSWMTPEIKQFSLKPREIKPIQLIINIPKDALAGGHYAAVVLETLGASPEMQAKSLEAVSGMGTNAQLASLLSLRVKGPVKEDALLKRFEAAKQIFELGPVDFITEIENLSDIHIRPKGEIIVRNMFGKIKDQLPLEEKNIFPYASKLYTNKWNVGLGFGRYSAQIKAAWGSGQVLTGLVYFWLIPWKLIIAVLVLLALVILIYLSIHSHLRHKRLVSDKNLREKEAEINCLKQKLNQLQKGPPRE